MINVFTDPLFRLGIAYLATRQAVVQRTAHQTHKLNAIMTKLTEAQRFEEVQGQTGPYMKMVPAAPAPSIQLIETAREEPPLPMIVRWDQNTWLRWHPEEQEYMVMKNPPKPQGRLA